MRNWNLREKVASLFAGHGQARFRHFRPLVLLFGCALLAICVAIPLGSSWSLRQSSHDGFFLVSVANSLPAAEKLDRPRHTVVVVLDGLSYQEAVRMRSLLRLKEQGQCRKTYVGPVSISRPVYATISTGLEADRTGVRNNDDTSPLKAESLWEIARRSGMSVAAISELPWWQELFPRGFSSYLMPPREADYFRLAPLAELTLVHPVYIDETAHAVGAAGKPYQAAVARADAELGGLLGRLDLTQDLLVVTADHGHSLRGGHGGQDERVAYVWTCYAGVGIRPKGDADLMPITNIAPSLALLLKLPFPAEMRAGDDALDQLDDIADPAKFSAGYLAQRRASIAHFRAQNRAALLRWHPESHGSWTEFYRFYRQKNLRTAILGAMLGALVLGLLFHAHRRQDAWFGVAFVMLFFVFLYSLQITLRGSFDLSSVRNRPDFIHFTSALCLLCGLSTGSFHLAVRRNLRAFLLDLSALLFIAVVAYLTHPLVLGWQLGFPVPNPAWIFFPYFATLLLVCIGGLCLTLVLVLIFLPRTRHYLQI